MKRFLLLLAVASLVANPAWAQSAYSTNMPPNGPPPGGPRNPLSKEERQEVRQARDTALQADPALAAEGRDLEAKMRDYHQKVNAAMIKADPNVAPLLAKMDAAHPHHGGGAGGPPPDDGGGMPPPPPGK